MFGISWGGFNAIQMAARNPPALKAFIAVDATDDLYQDDVHYIDGIMHLDSWEMSQDLDNARPGAPGLPRSTRAYFRDRFDTPPWMLTWKREQRDGPFWDRASLRGAVASRSACPAFTSAAGTTAIATAIPRMLEHAGRTREGDDRAVVARLAARALPEARHGVAPRGRALVRSLAEGRRHRDPERAAIRGVRARLASAGTRISTPRPGDWRWEDGWPIARIRARTLLNLRDDHTLGDADARAQHAPAALRRQASASRRAAP